MNNNSKRKKLEALIFDKKNCAEYTKKSEAWTKHKINFQQTTDKFVDVTFPQNETNSHSDPQWLRPEEINSSYHMWTVYTEPITSTITYQGNLGDCWFLSGLFDFKF